MTDPKNNPRFDQPTPVHAAIALGSNLGDRRAHLNFALDRLKAHPDIKLHALSRWFETQPVGGPPGQGLFLNGAATIETALPAPKLLTLLLAIEADAGRVRQIPGAQRTLDLDLLLYGDEIIDQPGLTVPHPRLHERRFVLDPLDTIAPDWIHPVLAKSVHQLWLACVQEEDPVSLQAHPAPPAHETRP